MCIADRYMTMYGIHNIYNTCDNIYGNTCNSADSVY